MIIRVFGTVVGVFFVIGSVLMLSTSTASVVSGVSILFLGLIFVVYGVAGKKELGKIFPSLVRSKHDR
jgi:multisubunit Na+/H+ antiporter MnhC subunit